MISEQELLARFRGVTRSGAGWAACCPVPDHGGDGDLHRSLTIALSHDRWLFRCQRGCPPDAVLGAVGLTWSDMFQGNGGEPVIATYTYTDADGTPVLRVNRTASKRFFQQRPEAGTWINGGIGRRTVLYRLPQVAEAIRTGQAVFVVEGEKDADLLARHRFPSTTAPMGASTDGAKPKWKPGHADLLRDAYVYVIPDADIAGRAHAEAICRSLQGKARSARLLDLYPGETREKNGRDVSDWFSNGGSPQRLIELAKATPIWEPPPPLEPAPLEPPHEEIPDPPTAEETASLISGVNDFIARFIHASEQQLLVCSVWTAHTWVIEAVRATPYLQITSPEPDSGKSTLAEVLQEVVRRPLASLDPSDAVVYRVIEVRQPTLILDEIDNVLPSDAHGPQRAILGLLNAGYRRGQVVHRMSGKNRDELAEFNIFCPKILVGIDKGLKPTLASRCLRIDMEPATEDEMRALEEFDPDEVEEEAASLRERLAEWARRAVPAIQSAPKPERIPGLKRRQSEMFKALLAVSALAGAEFDFSFRDALKTVATGERSTDATVSIGRRLLADVQSVFDSFEKTKLPTETLLAGLFTIQDAPWAEWWGWTEPGTRIVQPTRGGAMKLATRLKRYGIHPRALRDGGAHFRGYAAEDFAGSFERYLSNPAPEVVAGCDIPAPEPKTDAFEVVTEAENPPGVTTSEWAANPHGSINVTTCDNLAAQSRNGSDFPDVRPAVPAASDEYAECSRHPGPHRIDKRVGEIVYLACGCNVAAPVEA